MTASLLANQPVAAYSRPVDPCVITGTSLAFVSRTEGEREWDRVIRSLKGLEVLEDDWDGQGAEAPAIAVIWKAIGVAKRWQEQRSPAPATATATPAGTVLFTWREASVYAEAELMSPDRLEWMFKELGQPASHGEVDINYT